MFAYRDATFLDHTKLASNKSFEDCRMDPQNLQPGHPYTTITLQDKLSYHQEPSHIKR